MASCIMRISSMFIILSILLSAHAQSKPPPFPKIKDIKMEFYQTEVQITDIYQQITGLANEYYDDSGPRGRVDLLVAGNRQSVIYNNQTGEILDINATTCKASDIELSEDDYIPLFYGWLNRDPLIIGPSAPLWYAQKHRDEIVAQETKASIRNIDCWKYSLNVTGPRDKVLFDYYFATDEWTTPYSLSGMKVLLRIDMVGKSSMFTESADEWQDIDLIVDFAYFKPIVDNLLVFRPPLGIGCKLKKATISMPPIPKTFKYTAETYNVLAAEETEISNIEYQEVWYDSSQMVARLDQYKKGSFVSELYDFNTGVTYSIVNGETCIIKPLQKSIFEAHGNNRVIGQMKDPNEVMNFDGDFYYMGKRSMRGIWCDSFESLQENVVFMDKTLAKLVITTYYSQAYYKVFINGEEESQIPIAYTVTGWNATDKTIEIQYSIFAFDDVIWPAIYESFNLGRCFPAMNDKSYFLMILDVPEEVAAKMEDTDDLIVATLRDEICTVAKISDMRLPLLEIDYKSSGVYVTGLMLDRPPALKQFFMEYEGDVTVSDNYLKPAIDADTKEKCAYACVDNDDFTCKGFYWCNTGCMLKSKDILEPSEEDERKTILGETCQTWLRATRDSTNTERYLRDALERLSARVLEGNFTLPLIVDEAKFTVIVNDIVIGDGPYTGDNNQDKPYSGVMNFAKLKKEDPSTFEMPYVDNLNDCYRSCMNSDSISCAGFSYCPDSPNKQCMLSSKLMVNRKINFDDVEDDKNCYVYSLKHLDFFQAYPGRTVLLSGEEVFSTKVVEECAKKCLDTSPENGSKYQCRGFEFCREAKSCVLHSKHVLDLKPGEIAKGKPACIHYAAKYSADYLDMGYNLIEDPNPTDRLDLSLEECAKVCSEELKESCASFNYCPASDTENSQCYPSSLKMSDKVKTYKKYKCHHFEKKKSVDDWARITTSTTPSPPVSTPRPPEKLSQEGYTSKGFTGLVMGMLALGLILGVLGFFGYSYYRSRKNGEGLSVRFVKSDI